MTDAMTETADKPNLPDPVVAAPVLTTPVLTAPGGKLIDGPLTVVRIGVLTISDTRDEDSDTSGKILADRIAEAGHLCSVHEIVPDDVEAIRARVRAWISAGSVDAVITTGGTGLTGRDVTPEALEPLFDKRIDGFSVIFHQVSYQTIGLSTLQSRATAGIIDGVFVFCLPGSNGAVRDGWDKVIRWQLDSRYRPCNMVELMPRLLER
ncbi:molybdenum cofactor biosynthesis protein B [soil metagenome]